MKFTDRITTHFAGDVDLQACHHKVADLMIEKIVQMLAKTGFAHVRIFYLHACWQSSLWHRNIDA